MNKGLSCSVEVAERGEGCETQRLLQFHCSVAAQPVLGQNYCTKSVLMSGSVLLPKVGYDERVRGKFLNCFSSP